MLRTSLLAVSFPACVLAQQVHVVPAAQALADGNHAFAVAGTYEPRRQVTLIDGSLLQPLIGRTLTALSLRRDGSDRAFAAGELQLTIRLAHAPRAWNDASPQFAANLGAGAVTVFSGAAVLPASPATAGAQVPWTTGNALRVPFAQPFVYQGGTLAVELIGSPGAQVSDWWVADAVRDVRSGQVQQVGTGCGPFGGVAGEWSFVDAPGIVPGATVAFAAAGPAQEFALWAVATGAAPFQFDLAAVGAPGCFVHLAAPLAAIASGFSAPAFAHRPDLGGVANVSVQIPAHASFLGLGMASQWFQFGAAGLTASNAHAWQVALQSPLLPMTLVTAPLVAGAASEGKVIPGCGLVFAFDSN